MSRDQHEQHNLCHEERRIGSMRADQTTGFILAGGKSRRMGQDKALLQAGSEFLISYPIRVFQSLTPDVRIVGDPQRYSFLGLPVVADCVPSCGPLSGIYTGLKSSSTRINLFLACDMPLMRPELFVLLLSELSDADTAVIRFSDGFIEPLCSIYCTTCLPAIEDSLSVGKFKVSGFFSRIDVAYIEEAKLQEHGFERTMFSNVNTPDEFRQLIRRNAF
jgi:molybdopterin-guanine dinucleotide biosynthesis protein A